METWSIRVLCQAHNVSNRIFCLDFSNKKNQPRKRGSSVPDKARQQAPHRKRFGEARHATPGLDAKLLQVSPPTIHSSSQSVPPPFCFFPKHRHHNLKALFDFRLAPRLPRIFELQLAAASTHSPRPRALGQPAMRHHAVTAVVAIGAALVSAHDYTPKHEQGRCAFRGQCGKQSFFGKELPCVDNGVAQDPEAELRSELVDLCGEEWREGPVCCTLPQVCVKPSFNATVLQI